MLRRVITRAYTETRLNMRGLIAVLNESLTPTETKSLFTKIDVDLDGDLSVKEIQSAICGNILQMESVILKLLDDVTVPMPTTNFADFMIFVAKRKRGQNKIRQVFDEYDKDGDGLISPTEVKEWLEIRGKYITSVQADKMDYTGDGAVEYDEFLSMITARLLCIKLK